MREIAAGDKLSPYVKIALERFKQGNLWSQDEIYNLLDACQKHGPDWEKVEQVIASKTQL